MAVGSSIQFRGKAAVIEAFENVDAKAFTIWQGKQYLFKGMGEEELEAFLNMLEQNSMNCIYTVKVYEDIADKKAIKSNTPDDGSFNFRLNADEQLITNNQYAASYNRNELISKIGALENKFDTVMAKLEEEPEEDEQPNRLGIIGDIIAHPAIAPIIPQLAAMLMGMAQRQGQNFQQPRVMQPGTVGNIPSTNNSPMLNDAIERLKLADSKLAEHLLKLANLAEKDPGTFAMFLQTLEAYQLK